MSSTEVASSTKSSLALLGGHKAITKDPADMFTWPIITSEDEQAVLEMIHSGVGMSGTDVTKQLEKEVCEWLGVKYALGYCNGTASLLGAMFGCGVGIGDEIIIQSPVYWAAALPALSLGATINFADILGETLCIDPADIEHRIGEDTKAIVVVHNCAYPAEMDEIMAIAEKHNVKVIEDVSHAQGGLYKGRALGTIGHVGAFSMMAGKSLVAGEGGMLITNDQNIFERAVAFGHYERTGMPSMYSDAKGQITNPELKKFAGVPLGGYKHRLNQVASSLARVQLKYYPQRIVEIQKAINRFWDLLEGVPGIKAHRPPADSGSTMGGWYAAKGLYRPEELGGLDVEKFCQALTAEGFETRPGINGPLHLHPALHDADVYGHGKPTVIANASRDVRQGPGSLPVA
ncbi:MAG: aminotransferase class I/II-fold pyridoxal phosphate-dependent enzyme, partial [Phycisphaerae bacterium]|nr:aminotransferase class I/II-fold pyridoxal phosphate-dependent enzyme [Phycisphaerae bacterium]